MKRHLPNFFTCLNLSCGFLALILILYKGESQLLTGCFLIGLAAFFDFFDGMAARLLNQYSDFGKELDSLADMVSFGIVPGAIMFQLILHTTPDSNGIELALVSTCVPICSALRLAKFNVESYSSDLFIGMPTPANAIFIGSLPLVMEYGQWGLVDYLGNTGVLLIITGIVSFLLISPIEMFSLKFKDLGWAGNELRYVFLLISAGFLIVFHITAIPFIIILYVLLSTIKYIVGTNSNN